MKRKEKEEYNNYKKMASCLFMKISRQHRTVTEKGNEIYIKN